MTRNEAQNMRIEAAKTILENHGVLGALRIEIEQLRSAAEIDVSNIDDDTKRRIVYAGVILGYNVEYKGSNTLVFKL